MKRIFRGEDEARGRFLEEKRTQEDARGSKRKQEDRGFFEEARGSKRTQEDGRGSKRIEDFRGRKRREAF